MPPIPLKGYPNEQGTNKPDISDMQKPGKTGSNRIEGENRMEMSPMRSSVQSVNRDEPSTNNNSPGRLKFFKGKYCGSPRRDLPSLKLCHISFH